MSAQTPSALARLVEGLVDYAGLFPPAALPMDEAVQKYADYRKSGAREMLSRFVVPVARLDEFVAAAQAIESDGAAWPLAVLASAADVATLDAFNAAHRVRWRIDTVEARAQTTAEIAALAEALSPRYAVYVELPLDADPTPLVEALRANALRAKIRTGGVVADAFPAPSAIARFLAACAANEVPFKATAGLHHPLRGEYPLTYETSSAQGTMFGFLNVFLVAAFLHAGKSVDAVAPLLEERDASAIDVAAASIRWRDLELDADAVTAARAAFAGSFGSCSFDEPVRELAALELQSAPR